MYSRFIGAGALYFLRAKLQQSFKTSFIKDMHNNSTLLQLKEKNPHGSIDESTLRQQGQVYKSWHGSCAEKLCGKTESCTRKSNVPYVLNMQEDLFDEALHPADDEILADLQRSSDPPKELEQILSKLLEVSAKVLEPQLKPYLTGEHRHQHPKCCNSPNQLMSTTSTVNKFSG